MLVFYTLKGTVLPKINVLSSLTQLCVIPNLFYILSSVDYKKDIFKNSPRQPFLSIKLKFVGTKTPLDSTDLHCMDKKLIFEAFLHQNVFFCNPQKKVSTDLELGADTWRLQNCHF